jgi:hypothetical protein
MRTFKRTSLPETVNYNGENYTLDIKLTSLHHVLPHEVELTALTQKKKIVTVEVMHKNLKGKNDYHGQPYKPNVWIFSRSN